jgi:protein TonB
MGGGNPGLGGGTGHPAVATSVDTRPIPLNSPRPSYTEDARKNKVQGVVRVRVLVGADGVVKKVTVLSGLPDGLNEEAIRAAYQIRFRPATKSGQAVAFWQAVDIEFNLR